MIAIFIIMAFQPEDTERKGCELRSLPPVPDRVVVVITLMVVRMVIIIMTLVVI